MHSLKLREREIIQVVRKAVRQVDSWQDKQIDTRDREIDCAGSSAQFYSQQSRRFVGKGQVQERGLILWSNFRNFFLNLFRIFGVSYYTYKYKNKERVLYIVPERNNNSAWSLLIVKESKILKVLFNKNSAILLYCQPLHVYFTYLNSNNLLNLEQKNSILFEHDKINIHFD